MIDNFCITELRLLLAEMSIEGYETIEQVKGAIYSRIDELEIKKNSTDAYIEGGDI